MEEKNLIIDEDIYKIIVEDTDNPKVVKIINIERIEL